MTVKEFLITSDFIKVKALAEKMYPTNSDAQSYLRRKLIGKERTFTPADASNALDKLKKLSFDISNLTIE